jgi:hypothetical protein
MEEFTPTFIHDNVYSTERKFHLKGLKFVGDTNLEVQIFKVQ